VSNDSRDSYGEVTGQMTDEEARQWVVHLMDGVAAVVRISAEQGTD